MFRSTVSPSINVPSSEVTAFCDFTKPTIFSRDYLPAPGQQVNEDFSFEMPSGEQAIFCWGLTTRLGFLHSLCAWIGASRGWLDGDPPEVSHDRAGHRAESSPERRDDVAFG